MTFTTAGSGEGCKVYKILVVNAWIYNEVQNTVHPGLIFTFNISQ